MYRRNLVTASLELGFNLTGLPTTRGSAEDQLNEYIDLAHVTRDSGFSYLVKGQHFLARPYRFFHTIPLLTRLIPETGSMRLVTGVMLLSLLPPVDVAEQLATLDILSGGRLVFGYGSGYRDEEFQAFGVRREDRARRATEGLNVIRALWRGLPVDFDGEFFHVHTGGASIVPTQQPEPPIWMAAMSEVTVRRAAEQGVLAYLGPRVPESRVQSWVNLYRDVSGDPTARLPLRRELFIHSNRARAWDLAERFIRERYDDYRRWGMDRGLAEDGRTDTEFPKYLRARVIAGDPGECSETIARYAETGASALLLRCLWPSLPKLEARKMVELAGKAAGLVGAA
jgi:alkanesulfonate monooxygenase SsuD/methylene tetrahydromethanopterin reductase-like flavin-dependent oxidoreductase (luciferase family)